MKYDSVTASMVHAVSFFLHNVTFWEDKKKKLCSKNSVAIMVFVVAFSGKYENFRKNFFAKIDENS
jgi:hypothetical protein